MGGGYRRKADQDTLGRNNRLRYSYLASDKKMIPHSNARLRGNQNKPIGRTLQPDLGKFVAVDFNLSNDGITSLATARDFDVLITDVSGLVGTLYRLEAEVEILANPVLGTSAHVQTILVAFSVGKSFIQSQIDNVGHLSLTNVEFQIATSHRKKVFEARRFRVLFYNIDSGSPVLEKTSAFTKYFCYSPEIGIANAIDASIKYTTPNNTVFDTSNFSQTAKIFTRFDNIAFTGDSGNQNFKLEFNAGSTTSSSGIFSPTQVFYAQSGAFDPNIGLSFLEVELLQPDGAIMENYSVNNHGLKLIPDAWPSVVKKQLGYGWDTTWDSAASVSPSSITTFNIASAVVRLVEGQTLTNQWKYFNIQMDSIIATNIANVGYRIYSDNIITALRSGKSQYQYYTALQQAPLNPAVTTPALLHTTVLRTYGATTDDIQGPILANLDTSWKYTGQSVLRVNDMFEEIVVPPYFNTITLALQNQTQNGYDIVVTAFDGFTAFNQNGASGETPYYTIELNISDAATATNIYTATNIQFTGSTLPFTIKTVSRAAGSSDLSWFPANFTGGHDISIDVRYTVATSGFTLTVFNPPAGPFMMYSGLNVLSTSGYTSQSLNDLIGINQLTNADILDQENYYSASGTDYDVKKAFNSDYQITSSSLRDWVALNTSTLRLWAWIDLGQLRTINRIRLWQQENVVHHRDRVKTVKMYITNNILEASLQWAGSHTFDFDRTADRANCDLYYTNNSGSYIQYDAVNDFDHIGRDSLDPTLAKTNSATTGFWEFRFDNSYFPSAGRTGRYLYIRFDRRFPQGQPRIAQAQILGY